MSAKSLNIEAAKMWHYILNGRREDLMVQFVNDYYDEDYRCDTSGFILQKSHVYDVFYRAYKAKRSTFDIIILNATDNMVEVSWTDYTPAKGVNVYVHGVLRFKKPGRLHSAHYTNSTTVKVTKSIVSH